MANVRYKRNLLNSHVFGRFLVLLSFVAVGGKSLQSPQSVVRPFLMLERVLSVSCGPLGVS